MPLFFCNDTATTEIYTLSLHDALPILGLQDDAAVVGPIAVQGQDETLERALGPHVRRDIDRSEEHTSELQSRRDLVCRLLLEKKKKTGSQSLCFPVLDVGTANGGTSGA